jgi:hypothetical protein
MTAPVRADQAPAQQEARAVADVWDNPLSFPAAREEGPNAVLRR